MTVLNIHGYHGNPKNSAEDALKNANLKVISPAIDYDNEDPADIMNRLLISFCENDCEGVVGTSLGGFYAMLISSKMSVPTVLINPAMVPGLTLPTLGYKRPAGVRGMKALENKFMNLDLRNITTIIGTDDEIIDKSLRDYTRALLRNKRFYEVVGGKHSGSTLGLNELFKKHKEEWFDDILAKDIY